VPYITKENAKELHAKALERKRQLKAERELLAQNQDTTVQVASKLKAFEDRLTSALEVKVPPPPDDFQERRLARVRAQLEGIDSTIEAELSRKDGPDAQRLDRLAAASARLEEQERRLSDRSLPAVKRDNGIKKSAASSMLDP
jgi:hypothetical protein